ncbi:hypothetical protein BT63DRAFT_474652 [Microthyrium microscopicum]|uniref:Uroporphyrin-III C-methyltransferase n=1 Tax=Microthyrium microscopicum TaxID=703497 RepID=A0A6A6UU66_9PEZI|nr:hypothetical protein BT63DRAFT_474652 [Microthyrium microscopicum]
MSTAIWPPIASTHLAKEEEDSLAKELEWLLESLQDTLKSLKDGLDEVATLMTPSETGSTLVLSTHRSESVKGFVTRLGTRITKGDIKLRLATLPPPRGMTSYPLTISNEPDAPALVLDQLSSVRALLNACLDVVDASTWAGDIKNPNFIAGQLRLLDVNLQQAKAALKGGTESQQLPWYKNVVDENTFTPPLPPNVSFHLCISDAALVLELRTLELQTAGHAEAQSSFSILGFALGASRPQNHDEVDEIFTWKGQDAKVKEKIRVESSDPILMMALAKLISLERTIALARRGLDTNQSGVFDPRSRQLEAPPDPMAPALLTAVDSTDHVHIIIGSNPLAGARCSRSIEVGAKPKLIAAEDALLHYSISKRIELGEVEWVKGALKDEMLTTLGREEVDGVVDAVFVTLPVKNPLRTHISNLCRRLRIPVNITDSHSLSTFTILSTHCDGPLQIGITTSGKGCKLSSRIKREIAASLPQNLGLAVERLGSLRKKFIEEDNKLTHALEDDLDGEDEDLAQPATFNQLIRPEDVEAARDRRMRWLAQICEYWPLKRLASITDADIDTILNSYRTSATSAGQLAPTATGLDARIASRRGRIILAGSGPGSPDLLTLATLNAIKAADVILADKLVPAPVLDLIPRRTPVHIARKFPGNAEAAQDELLEMGIKAVSQGQTVLRLKQGDPFLYGRGGEEVRWFRAKGVEPLVLPGVTSSLAAPLFAGIPVTMRDVADQLLVCTGTGRKGALPAMPEYVSTRTVVLLMALHRLPQLVAGLTGQTVEGIEMPKNEHPWPADTPCTIVERASCRDQRVIRSTLQHVCAAVEELGSRPPGLLVLGRACGALKEWDGRWVVEEGFEGVEDIGGLGISELEEMRDAV